MRPEKTASVGGRERDRAALLSRAYCLYNVYAVAAVIIMDTGV